MSGHSKWSTIKHKKAITDAQKGKIFTKMANTIIVTVKEGGGDPEKNFKLKATIEKAKEQNMPLSNIERAIKRGTGELGGIKIEEITYEAYGPAGIALIINAITDNKNRTVSGIRNILAKFGGKLGNPGSVSYLFEQKGVITLETKSFNSAQGKEELELAAIDAGAEDIEEQDDVITIYTKPNELFQIKKGLEQKGLKTSSAELSLEPKDLVKITDEQKAKKILSLMNNLDEYEDISSVSSNFEIPENN
ncbi:MAG: YebC/PmpR family DNA-binding transcriptional regulator [Candidatus Berkelbacteria bacterium]|nr:YebC/PmpR family DNA-binding transcriptional regulator [Candidatus Berkelbacteria bacterium]